MILTQVVILLKYYDNWATETSCRYTMEKIGDHLDLFKAKLLIL